MNYRTSKSDRIKRIRNLTESEGFELTQQEIDEINDTFEKVIKADRHKNKTQAELGSLIDRLTEHEMAFEDMDKVARNLGDYSYMSYYDTFMDGQSSVITQRLKENGLTPEILKHKDIRPDRNVDVAKDGFHIIQVVDLESDDSPKPIIQFDIYYGDRLIYSYEKEQAGIDYTTKYEKEIETDYGAMYERVTSKGNLIRQNEKGQFVRKDGSNRRTR